MLTQKTILATEQDGLTARNLQMTFLVNTAVCPDLELAVRDACNDYIGTKEGADQFSYNCNNFNWVDFWNNVPDTICRKYGFSKETDSFIDIEVNLDEHLVTEDDLPLSLPEWETLRDGVIARGEVLGFLKEVLLADGYQQAKDSLEGVTEPGRQAQVLDSLRPSLDLQKVLIYRESQEG